MALFDEEDSPFIDNYPWARELMQAMWDNPWTVKDFDFMSDVQDYKVHMDDQEREMVTRVISAIGQIEVCVKTYWSNLGRNLPQLFNFGSVMTNIEVIHNDAYLKLLQVLNLEDKFEEHKLTDVLQNRLKYLRKHTQKFHPDSKKQFVYSLVLFTLYIENVSLYSPFSIILWLKKNKNFLNDTSQQIKYTIREESAHTLGGVKIIEDLRREYPEIFDEELNAKIAHESEQMGKAEFQMIDWFLNGYDQPDLNADCLKEMVKDRINESLESTGFAPVFEINQEILNNMYWFEEIIHANSMQDFFAAKPVEYKRIKFTEQQIFGDE